MKFKKALLVSMAGCLALPVASQGPAGAAATTITTVAGGASGATGIPAADGRGDGAPATSVSSLMPAAVEIDPEGQSLYVSSGSSVRLVNLGVSPLVRHGVTVGPGSIETIAGAFDYPTATGRSGPGAPYNGDGGPAREATLGSPQDLDLDGLGNLFIADFVHERVRKVDASGTISTVAGVGPNFSNLFFCGFDQCRDTPLYPVGGDGDPAVEVSIVPYDVEVTSSGEVYIAEPDTNSIRRVDADGIISTVAGSGFYGYSGDGEEALEATMKRPGGIAIHQGGMLIADGENKRVRLVNLTDASITRFGVTVLPGAIATVAGGGAGACPTDGGPALQQGLLGNPSDLSIDAEGNMLISDPWCRRVYRVSQSGLLTPVAGDGGNGQSADNVAPTSSRVVPDDVAADSRGNFYVADLQDRRVRKVWDGAVRSLVAPADFDADGKTDVSVYRGEGGLWYVKDGQSAQWGGPGDKPVPADYDGDGAADIAVFRPENGTWFVKDGQTAQWGAPGDKPVPADYDGDGAADIAVFRPENGTWFVKDGQTARWGAPGDKPVPADYDGDGDADMAVFRPSVGTWFVKDGQSAQWGAPGDKPVPADYDGDGAADIAVFRPENGTWFVKDGQTAQWGAPGDKPVSGYYDSDAIADIAVYRPDAGNWFIKDQFFTQWGGHSTDIPLPSRAL